MMYKVFVLLCSMVMGYLAAPSNIGAGLGESVHGVAEVAPVSDPAHTIVEAKKVADEMAPAEERVSETVVKTKDGDISIVRFKVLAPDGSVKFWGEHASRVNEVVKADDAVEKAVKSASKNGEIYKVFSWLVPGWSLIYEAEQLARDSQKEAKNEPAATPFMVALSPLGSLHFDLLKLVSSNLSA